MEINYFTLISECDDGFYGRNNCNGQCGQCLADDVCHKTTGACPNGCQAGYTGNKCTDRESFFTKMFYVELCPNRGLERWIQFVWNSIYNIQILLLTFVKQQELDLPL